MRGAADGREELADTLTLTPVLAVCGRTEACDRACSAINHGHTVAMTGVGVNDVLAQGRWISVWRWASGVWPRVRWHRSCC